MHYLETELRELLRDNDEIVDFIESEALGGMWYWDLANPEHQWMGPGFWRLFGHDPKDKSHSSKEWQATVHPEDLPMLLENFREHSADARVPFDQLVRFRHRDGSTVWVRCRGRAIRDGDGRAVRMLGCHTDMTEVVRGERELRAFVEALPGVAMILDRNGTYKKIMSTGEQLLADTMEALIGKRVEDVLPPETSALIMGTISRALASGEPQLVEYKLRTQETLLWFEGRVVPFSTTEPEEKTQVIWLAHDITDRKIAGLELQQKNEDLRQFAHVASHDLRSPLHTIKQLASWIKEDNGDALDEDGKKHLDLILRRATRMDDLVTGLLRYARTSDHMIVETVATRVALSRAIEMVNPPGGSFQIEITRAPDAIQTDRVLFEQIVQNLVGNAIKHHDRASGRIEVSVEAMDGGHRLSVADDGPGIPEEYRSRIFEIFQTLKPRDEEEASGIGLAIVKKAADILGGEVQVESHGGRGATFHVLLPQDPSAAKVARATV